MDLRTTYLGFDLPHPLMPGASPLVDDLDTVRRLEDAGAAAIVMHSLFEEQITREQFAADRHLGAYEDSSPEALSYFPHEAVFGVGPDAYLERIRRIRESVAVPVIASLNGATIGGWLDYARLMVEAGAHALELNLYSIPTDPEESGQQVEDRAVEIVRTVCGQVPVPVAVKLSPFWSSLPAFVRRLEGAGAKGVVLFNRFYQPDIDPEALDVVRTLRLSDPLDLRLRLRGIAIVWPATKMSIAATGGVLTGLDAVKAVMAGASGIQMVSALLRHGPGHLGTVLEELRRWFEEHEYDSLRQAVGSMSLARCPDPSAYERGNYVQILQSWHG
jgi:dihydroorotate dehydrogenase (fumarate)